MGGLMEASFGNRVWHEQGDSVMVPYNQFCIPGHSPRVRGLGDHDVEVRSVEAWAARVAQIPVKKATEMHCDPRHAGDAKRPSDNALELFRYKRTREEPAPNKVREAARVKSGEVLRAT